MARTRSLAGLLALLCALGVCTVTGGAALAFTAPLVGYGSANGSLVCDTSFEINPPYSDVSCASGSSGWIGASGNTVSFGLVTEIDPRDPGNGGPLQSMAYVVAIAVNGVQVATVGVNGKGTNNTDYVYAKCFGLADNYEKLASTALSDGSLAINKMAGTAYYRMDFDIPLASLTSCGITPTTDVQLYYGTSTAANLDVINKDYFRTGDSSVNFAGLATIKLGGSLDLAKTVTPVSGPNPPAPGQTSTYDLTVTARDYSMYALNGVDVTDDLPTGVTLISQTRSAGSVTATGQHLEWSGFDLLAGTSATLVMRVSITPSNSDVGSAVLLNAGATGTAARGDGVNVSATSNSVSSGVVAGPIYTLTKTASPTFVATGGTVSYTMTLANTGNVAGSIASIVDTLPNGFAFVAGSTSGTLATSPPATSGGTVTWTGPFAIGVGASKTLTFSALASSSGGSYVNNATANAVSGVSVSTGPTASVTVNSAPTAVPDTATTTRNTAVSVDAVANDTDPDPGTALHVVAVGPVSSGSAVVDATTGRIVYTPAQNATGTTTFGYTISDGSGGTASSTVTVTVPNAAPVARPDSLLATPGIAQTVDVVANDTDADGDSPFVTSVSTAAHGLATLSGGVVRYTADTSYVGADTFTYTIGDGHGGTATGSVSVTIPNTRPTATSDSAATSVGLPVTVDVLRNDSDPNDGQALSISTATTPQHGTADIVNGKIIYTPDATYLGLDGFDYTISDGFATSTAHVSLTVSAGDPVAVDDSATTDTDQSVVISVTANDAGLPSVSIATFEQPTVAASPPSGVAAGTTTASADGTTITYTPPSGFTGTAAFSYTITNGTTISSPATVTITVLNAPPVAAADAFPADRSAGQAIDVLGNDSDANHDVLAIQAVSGVSVGATVTVESAPGAQDLIRYTPPSDFVGTDTFSYVVSDGRGGSASALVTVSVGDGAPAAQDDAAAPTTAGAVSVDVLANDSDPDNDPLTVGIGTAPAHGTAAVNADQTVTYTPDAAYTGVDSFTYSIDDGHGKTATATVTVTTPNTAPVALDDTATTVVATPVTVTVLANDTDVNTAQALSVTTVGTPAHGTADLNADGTVTYTPAATYRGGDSFGYTVSDGITTSSATITVSVTQRPPVAVDDSTSTPTDSPVTVAVLANDTDADGDVLAVVPGSVTAPVVVVPIGPSGVTAGSVQLNPNNAITFTPATGFHGTVAFEYTVTDGVATDVGSVTVTVLNAPPIAVSDSITATPGQAMTVPATANDIDANSDPLTVTAVSPAAHGTAAVTAGGVVTYAASTSYVGPDSFTYLVDDGNGGTDLGTVTVTVPNTPPTANPDVVATPADRSADIDVAANDQDPNTGQTLTLTVVSGPSHGTAVVTSTGRITYTPDSGYVGADAFTYRISDGFAPATAPVSVDVTGGSVTPPASPTPTPTPVVPPPVVGPPPPAPPPVIGPTPPVNHPPAYTDAVANTSQAVPAGAPLAPLAATDPDGDRLSYALVEGALPAGVTMNADGTFTGSATDGGSFPVTLRVCDDRTPSLCSLTRLVIRVAQPVLGPPTTAPSPDVPIPAVPPAVTTLPAPRPTPSPAADGGALLVRAAPVRPMLPRTGAPIAGLLRTGLLSTLLGLGFAIAGRRRHAT